MVLSMRRFFPFYYSPPIHLPLDVMAGGDMIRTISSINFVLSFIDLCG